jgi:enoyl-[acyl-carrier protein] reductase II
MKPTHVCEVLGIEYPIIQGGMTMAGNAELAAAVSEGGGLGMIGANPGWVAKDQYLDNLRRQIHIARRLTSKPVGVNFTIFSIPPDLRIPLMELAAEEGITIAGSSGGNPNTYVPVLKQLGMKVLHVVGNARQARKAEDAGADVVVAEGFEAAGVNGPDEIPTLALIPIVADAVRIPIVAAGGIADGRGLAAVLALGAEGVQLGTRFIASVECHAHAIFKDAILACDETGTIIIGRKVGAPHRVSKNLHTLKLYELDFSSATKEDVQAEMATDPSTLKGQLLGDADYGRMSVGAGAGLIKEILPAAEIIRRIIAEADATLERLAARRGQAALSNSLR